MKRENAWNPNQGGHRGLPLPQAPVGAAPGACPLPPRLPSSPVPALVPACKTPTRTRTRANIDSDRGVCYAAT